MTSPGHTSLSHLIFQQNLGIHEKLETNVHYKHHCQNNQSTIKVFQEERQQSWKDFKLFFFFFTFIMFSRKTTVFLFFYTFSVNLVKPITLQF